jgi:hypothetical protein
MEIEEFEAEVKKILLRDPLAYRALMAYSALNYEDKIKFNNIMKYIHGKNDSSN